MATHAPYHDSFQEYIQLLNQDNPPQVLQTICSHCHKVMPCICTISTHNSHIQPNVHEQLPDASSSQLNSFDRLQSVPRTMTLRDFGEIEHAVAYPLQQQVETVQLNGYRPIPMKYTPTSLHMPLPMPLPMPMPLPLQQQPYMAMRPIMSQPCLVPSQPQQQLLYRSITRSLPQQHPHPIQGVGIEQLRRDPALHGIMDVLWTPVISHLQVQPAQPESGPTITIAQEQPELRLEQPEVDPALGIPDPDGEPEGGPAVPARREKRARTAVTLQRKLEIIKYVERNRIHSTWKKMGEELQINRSTMQNIFKDKENIQKLSLLANEISPPFTMESSRLAQSNFYQMEVLLIKWAADMRAHQVPIPLVTIRWQAYAVHRLLSGLGAETLPPHKFCGEWFRKFALREDLREADHNNTVVPNNASPDLLRFRQLFGEYVPDNIFFCDVTSIFALPPCLSEHTGPCQLLSRREGFKAECKRGPAISLLLLCNASGTVKREPVMLDRILRNRLGQQRVELSDWLIAFDSELENSSLLLVSVVVWEQIKGMLQGLKLTNLRVEAVPVQLNKWLPMRTGIVREFKCYVNALNFEWTRDRSYPLGNVYQQAMQNVQGTVIQKCHQQFREVVQGTKPGKLFKGLTPGQRRLDQVLRVVHNVNDGSNDDVFQYYLNQDCDVGPSAFLGAEIEKMITNSTVRGFLDQDTRPVHEWWRYVVFN